MKVVCYGDSNTWGYDPRGYFGGQYDHPWPEILAVKTGWNVVNEGTVCFDVELRWLESPILYYPSISVQSI